MSTPTAPTLNRELLALVVKHIETYPERHDQAGYRYYEYEERVDAQPGERVAVRCDTVMCVAGWACDLAEGRWVDREYPIGHTRLITDELVREPEDDNLEYVRVRTLENGREIETVGADYRARRLLGLTRREASRLFYGLSDQGALQYARELLARDEENDEDDAA